MNWECIIIDDGSTDLSGKIVQQYISTRGQRWKYVYQENMGQAAARNSGINQSTGKYLAFLDADDISSQDRLQQQSDFLTNNLNILAVGSECSRCDEDKGSPTHILSCFVGFRPQVPLFERARHRRRDEHIGRLGGARNASGTSADG